MLQELSYTCCIVILCDYVAPDKLRQSSSYVGLVEAGVNNPTVAMNHAHVNRSG
jgi:hypothetical protein